MKLTLAIILLAGACAAADQTINVSGDAEIKVVPDQVVLSLGVEVHAKTLDEARRENDRRVQSVRAAALNGGIEEPDIQTDFIQLGIDYNNDGITPRFYYARKSIVLVLRRVDRMEALLAAAVDAGATHIHGVDFETTRLREVRDRARALAVQAAAAKARDMAAAAGMKVVGGPVGITSAQYGGRSWYGSGWGAASRGQMFQNVMLDNASASAPQATVALGRISVTANVSMQFRLE